MGIIFSLTKLFEQVLGKTEARLVMLGLDGAGKSTILMKSKFGEAPNTIPTIGFNVEEVQFGKVSFNIWDIGGQTQLRPLWRHYYPGTGAIVFVVDTADSNRLKTAKYELFKLLEEEDLRGAPLLIFANKMDLGINSVSKVTQELDLASIKGREWFCQGTSAINGSGLFEGFDWLAKHLKKNKHR